MKKWVFGLATVAAVTLAIGLGSFSGVGADDKPAAKKGQLTFEIYKDGSQDFRWRLKAANGQVIATSSQGYKAKADCQHGIELIQKGAARATVEDQSDK